MASRFKSYSYSPTQVDIKHFVSASETHVFTTAGTQY